MRLIPKFGAMLAIGLALFGMPAAAADENAAFRLSVGGIGAGSLSMAANRQGDRYAARVDMRGGGVVGALVDIYFGGTSGGTIGADGMPRPTSYDARRKIRDSDRRTLISFSGGRPSNVRQEPERRPRSWDIDPSAQRGTIDPVSATYTLLADQPMGKACNRRIDVFDGTRRSQLAVAGEQRTERGWICRGVYRRVAGFSPKQMRDRTEFPFTLFYVAAGDKMRLERFEAQSILGLAVARRQ